MNFTMNFTIIENRRIDLTHFQHPGGMELLHAIRGTDGTVLFNLHHPFSSQAREKLHQMGGHPVNPSSFYNALCQRLAPLQPQFQSDLWYMQVKGAIFWMLFVCSFMAHVMGRTSMPFLFIQYMFAGAVMHEAGHGLGHPVWRRIMLLTASFLGCAGTPRWIYKHLRHHAITNDEHDPELTIPFMRLRPSQPHQWWHGFQAWFATLLYMLFHVDVYIDHLQLQPEYVKGVYIPHSQAESVMTVVGFMALRIFLPIYMGSFYSCIWNEFVWGTVPALGIAWLFQVGHSLHAVHEMTPHDDWAVRQVQNTANYSPTNRIIMWLYGGLNYQIEHHLFPTLSHLSFPKIAPYVQQVCREQNVTYLTYPSFREAVWDHYKWLISMGRSKNA